jgi:hypothetical protein
LPAGLPFKESGRRIITVKADLKRIAERSRVLDDRTQDGARIDVVGRSCNLGKDACKKQAERDGGKKRAFQDHGFLDSG